MSSDSDELKDFRYYADKAEAELLRARKHEEQMHNPVIKQVALASATIYAELAKAAPKTEREVSE